MNWEKIAQTYAPGQSVRVIIDKVEHYGIFVRLADGTPGYVKRSEALYSERVVDLTKYFSPGEERDALVIALNAKYGNLDLSFKGVLPNPLTGFCKRHQTNGIVEGEVVQVTDNYALVEVEEGVTGLLPREELWIRSQPLPDVLMIEDRVRCMILSLEESKRPLLSIRALFLEEQDNSNKQSTYTLEDSISESFRISQWELKKQTEYEYQPSEEIIQAFQKVLLVDLNDTVIKPLSLLLDSYGFQTRMIVTQKKVTADDTNLFILSVAAAIDADSRRFLQADDLSKRTILFGTSEQFAAKQKALQALNCPYRITLPVSPAAIFTVMQAMSIGSPYHQDAYDTKKTSTEKTLFYQKILGSDQEMLLKINSLGAENGEKSLLESLFWPQKDYFT
ncbi:S1 RNA-binding domain-containing protein [candidate division KSB1 bacterium]|nr:S1 RNA-binding domain-containing protein [candidate division KSB1 bacterium]